MARILGVHGIGNYHYYRDNCGVSELAASALSTMWAKWLKHSAAGVAEEDIRVAYYAHHLHRGTPLGFDDPAAMEPEAQELLVSWVELLQTHAQVSQGRRTVRVRQAADWITCNFGPAVRLFVITFCNEVQSYLSDPDSCRRARARDAVASAISDFRPRVVIAHSLGSVVAYEALWEQPVPNVELFVTIGSPLAMPGVIFDRLRPMAVAGRGARPPTVERWVNIADIGDIVAIPREGLGPYFEGVERDTDVEIDLWDFHSTEKYLACAELRELLVK